jgi:uncharacterized protein YicC (UPF0701 family)
VDKEAPNQESHENGASITITPKEMARIIIAGFSLLAAGTGSLGYLAISHLADDDGGRFHETDSEWNETFTDHKQRVLETCRANREAVELQLDALQLQINALSERLAEVQSEDASLQTQVNEHIKEYNNHVKWGRESIIDEELTRSKYQKDVEKRLVRVESKIEEIYRILSRYLGRFQRSENESNMASK